MSKEQDERKYPASGYAWYMVIVLTIAYILSFVDRYVLGLLIEPIKADLALTDTQIGYLLGFAFAAGWIVGFTAEGPTVGSNEGRLTL